MTTTRLLGLAGSLRKASYNRALLRAAVDCAPSGVEIEIGSIDGIPVYDGDFEEAHGIPEPVVRLKDALAGAHGWLLVTPEYNHGIPGPLKNAIDWMSRPPGDQERVFGGKPVALIGATPGRGGTRFAQLALLPTIRTLGLRPWFDQTLYVERAHTVFDDGRLADDDVRGRLAKLIAGFAEFSGRLSRER